MKKQILWISAVLLIAAGVAILKCNASDSSKNGDKSGGGSASAQPKAFGVVSAPVPSIPRAMAAEYADAQTHRTLVQAQWGGLPGKLGKSRPNEANPEGPMSFGFTADGRMLALDQVNRRLAWFNPDGGFDRSQEVSQKAPQDVAVGPDGKVAVLDRLGDKNIEILDKDGRSLGKLPLEGPGIPEGGGVTGVFMDGDKVYAEYEHGRVILIGGTDGKPATDRTDLPGRPSRDGTLWLAAGIVNAQDGRMWVSATERSTSEHRFTRELRMPMPILRILLLDSDRAGIIYTATHLGDETLDQAAGVQVVCLDPQHGEPTGRVYIPVPDDPPEEIFRSMIVLEGGGVVIAVPGGPSMDYQVYYCQS
jgi:hypothetical protein